MKTITQKEWEIILSETPSNDDLRYIIEWVESKREEAKKLLNKNKKMIDIIKER